MFRTLLKTSASLRKRCFGFEATTGRKQRPSTMSTCKGSGAPVGAAGPSMIRVERTCKPGGFVTLHGRRGSKGGHLPARPFRRRLRRRGGRMPLRSPRKCLFGQANGRRCGGRDCRRIDRARPPAALAPILHRRYAVPAITPSNRPHAKMLLSGVFPPRRLW